MSKEYIEREALINRFEYYRSHNLPGGNVEKAFSVAKKEVAQAPAADVVEVVRCGECKHITPVEGGLPLCTHNAAVAYNDYCSYGERKDGAENGKSVYV